MISEISSSIWTGLSLFTFMLQEIFYFYWKLLLLEKFWLNRRESIFFFFYIPSKIVCLDFFSLRLDLTFFSLVDWCVNSLCYIYRGVSSLKRSMDLRYLSLHNVNFLKVLHLWICKWSSKSAFYYSFYLVLHLILIRED